MIGLTITGKSYNSENFEISLSNITGKVINKGISNFRFWVNNNYGWINIPVDFYYCAPLVNNVFDYSNPVSIPSFLLSSVSQAIIDNSLFSYVTGNTYSFSESFPYGTKDNTIKNCVLISKASCPVAYFTETGNPSFSSSEFYICYDLLSTTTLQFDNTTLSFIDPSKCSYTESFLNNRTSVANTSTAGTAGTSGTSGTAGTSGLIFNENPTINFRSGVADNILNNI